MNPCIHATFFFPHAALLFIIKTRISKQHSWVCTESWDWSGRIDVEGKWAWAHLRLSTNVSMHSLNVAELSFSSSTRLCLMTSVAASSTLFWIRAPTPSLAFGINCTVILKLIPNCFTTHREKRANQLLFCFHLTEGDIMQMIFSTWEGKGALFSSADAA